LGRRWRERGCLRAGVVKRERKEITQRRGERKGVAEKSRYREEQIQRRADTEKRRERKFGEFIR
jgi:hypothetical protein